MGAHTQQVGDTIFVDGGSWHDGLVEVQVTLTTWTNDPGLSWDVYVKVDGEPVLITEDESLDDQPYGETLAAIVKDWFDNCDHADIRIVDQTGCAFRCNRCGECVR